MKLRKPILYIFIVVVVVCAAIIFLFVDAVPPSSKTFGAMHMCKRRILRYAAKYNRLPKTLQETQPIEGFDSSIKDAWGVLLDYSAEPNGLVKLVSLGKDRKPGGTGNNRDMIGTFQSKQPDGSWSNEFVDWKQDPFKPFRYGDSQNK
jgi:hypothetical protein